MVIFDLDGTLYQTHETCLPSLFDLCDEYNIMLAKEDVKFLLYTTTKSLLDRVAPDMPLMQRDQFINDFKWREIECVKEKGRLFDGVKELLAKLATEGVTMAICGMGSKEYIDVVLTHCGIKHYFKYICHRIEGLTKAQVMGNLLKETGLKSNECLMVGDSITDFTAAKENHIPFIGVSYGYGTEDIKSANAIENNVTQLNSLIHQLMIFLKLKGILRHIVNL